MDLEDVRESSVTEEDTLNLMSPLSRNWRYRGWPQVPAESKRLDFTTLLNQRDLYAGRNIHHCQWQARPNVLGNLP